MFSLRRGKWKLIDGLGSGGFTEPRRYAATPEGPQGQLYDIAADGREALNLWSRRPEVVDELSARLRNYRKDMA